MVASHKEDYQQISASIEAVSANEQSLVWRKIAPIWPVSSIVAANPLQGYEDYHFMDAIDFAAGYYIDSDHVHELKPINQQTIKWAQVLIDKKHATINVPDAEKGMLSAFLDLLPYDPKLHLGNERNRQLIEKLRAQPHKVLAICLNELDINQSHHRLFLTLMLTCLPGWAGCVKYYANYHPDHDESICRDYLAMRTIITTLLWPNAEKLIDSYFQQATTSEKLIVMHAIKETEKRYTVNILDKLKDAKASSQQDSPDAQLIFCIDPRSELLRRSIESQGHYETFGFAGFFGLPLSVNEVGSDVTVNACPPIVKAKYHIKNERTAGSIMQRITDTVKLALKRSYYSLKYCFNSVFLLVDFIGLISGINMLKKMLAPTLFMKKQKSRRDKTADQQLLDSIELADQYQYAEQFLLSIGLVASFAKHIVICGHESRSENNAYATSLDCGACGGSSGELHASLMAAIMNNKQVRDYLSTKKNIHIPAETVFVSAVHVTSSDELYLTSDVDEKSLAQLNEHLMQAAGQCRKERAVHQFGKAMHDLDKHKAIYANNISQVRPEWGLVNNAAMVVGSRKLTKSIDLASRVFLHSYDSTLDDDCSVLANILAGPVTVAYWINMSYLFSALNNTLYGSGSKVTQNITGKQHVMQGNASDVMMGLPMQSIFQQYDKLQHEPVRLRIFIEVPKDKLLFTIKQNKEISKLVLNEWLFVFAIDPENQSISRLTRFHRWEKVGS